MPKAETEHTEMVWARVDSVIQVILENDRYLQSKRIKELTDKICEQFDVSDRTARKYIAEAKKEIRKYYRLNKEKAFAKAIQDREYLLQKAKGIKDAAGKKFVVKPDLKLALEIMKDREKLFGLYVEEVSVKGKISLVKIDTGKLTDEQLAILKSKIKNGENYEEYLKLQGLI